MIIYVSGPYSAETEEGRLKNTQTAIDIGIELIRRGHTVLIPHLSHYTDMRAQELGIEISWEQWLEQDLKLLERCDALYFIGESKGANLEREKALDRGLPVYCSLEEVPKIEKTDMGELLRDFWFNAIGVVLKIMDNDVKTQKEKDFLDSFHVLSFNDEFKKLLHGEAVE